MDLIEKTENTKRHPWELSRAYNILKFIDINQKYIYADVGAGDRFFASKLKELSNAKVYAVDSEYDFEKREIDGVICLKNIHLIEDNSIDCIVLMDVLEHIEKDSDFLKIVLSKLKPQGKIIITVPSFGFLFSSHDLFLKHYRRYSKQQLLKMMKINEIQIEKSFYFYTSLFILRIFVLFFEKLFLKKNGKNKGIGSWQFDEKNIKTRIIFKILNFDFFVNKLLKVNFMGLSIVAVGKKRKTIS